MNYAFRPHRDTEFLIINFIFVENNIKLNENRYMRTVLRIFLSNVSLFEPLLSSNNAFSSRWRLYAGLGYGFPIISIRETHQATLWTRSIFVGLCGEILRFSPPFIFERGSSTIAAERNRRVSIKIEVRFRFASSRSVTARAHVVLGAVVKSENWPIITHTHSYRQCIGTMARRFESVSNGRPQLEFELFTI